MMKIKKNLNLFIVSLFILNLTAVICTASEKISPDLVKFQGTGWETDDKDANIFMGTLHNISGRDIEFIGLRCAFFDAKGVQVDHGVVEVRDVAKDGIAKFKFYPPAPFGTVTATITEVDVYAKELAAPIQAAGK
jgi:hypothetical protein